MTIRIRVSQRNKNTATICNYVYCSKTKRSKPLRHGSLRLDADPNKLPLGIRIKTDYRLTYEDMDAIRKWLLGHGSFKPRDGYLELESALDLLYEQLEKQWLDITANNGTQKDFSQAWRRVQLIQDTFKNRLQELGAVKKMHKTAGDEIDKI